MARATAQADQKDKDAAQKKVHVPAPSFDLRAFNYTAALKEWDEFAEENEKLLVSRMKLDPPMEGLSSLKNALERMIRQAGRIIHAQKELQSVDDEFRLAIDHEELCIKREEEMKTESNDRQALRLRMKQGVWYAQMRVLLKAHEAFVRTHLKTTLPSSHRVLDLLWMRKEV